MPRGRAPLTVVVLAAGQGTRMRSKTIKLLHPSPGGRWSRWRLDAVRALRPSASITVVGFQADRVREALGDGAARDFVLQKEQRGTGHAVMQAARQIGRRGHAADRQRRRADCCARRRCARSGAAPPRSGGRAERAD